MRQCRAMKYLFLLMACALVHGAIALDFPASGGAAVFDQNGTYTASGDYFYSTVTVNAANATLDLSPANGRKMTIEATGESFVLGSSSQSVVVRGGLLDFSSTGKFCVGVNGTAENTLELTDHAVATNLNGLVIGNQKHRNTFRLTNGSRVYSTTINMAVSSCKQNAFEVLSGSHAIFSGSSFNLDYAGTPSSATGHNTVLVHGEGSLLSFANGTMACGAGHSCEAVVVDDGAEFTGKSVVMGDLYTKANGTTYYSDGNTFAATNSIVSLSSLFTIGKYGSFNTAILRNVNFSCKELTIGQTTNSSNNVFSVRGVGSKFAATDTAIDNEGFFFGYGHDNELCLADGASYTLTGDVCLSRCASNNVVRTVSNASINHSTGSVRLGYDDVRSCGNKIFVGEGGSNTYYRLYVYGHDNALVVSNGTFVTNRGKTSADSNSMAIGVTSDKPGITTGGCRLEVLGSCPRIRCEGQLSLDNDTQLRFGLPEATLETTPIVAKRLTMTANVDLTVDCDAYLRYLGQERARVVLATATTMEINSAVITAANAKLPERCKLVLEGQELILKIRGNKGIVVIVR